MGAEPLGQLAFNVLQDQWHAGALARYGHQFTIAPIRALHTSEGKTCVNIQGDEGPGYAFYFRAANAGMDKTVLMYVLDKDIPSLLRNLNRFLGAIYETFDEAMKVSGLPFLGPGEMSN